MNVPYHFIYRIIIIGEPSVGKTSLANCLVSGKSIITHPTVGIDFFSTINIVNDNIIIKSHLWDTAGQ